MKEKVKGCGGRWRGDDGSTTNRSISGLGTARDSIQLIDTTLGYCSFRILTIQDWCPAFARGSSATSTVGSQIEPVNQVGG
jgi:hypothetical protein